MHSQIGFPTYSNSDRGRTPRETFAEELAADWLSVHLEVSVRADIRRLFHALTDPEYLEAWLILPGERSGGSISASRYERDYLIEHFCDGGQSLLISGRYLVLRRRHVMFTWRVDGDISVPESSVEIRLRGDFERTTLTLRHSGFSSRHDSGWHRDLWNASIGRLEGLYGARRMGQETNRQSLRDGASLSHDAQANPVKTACGSTS
jgi:uncharacterized protein YndB with AHSA1/START domain